jgi:hypothetical protein
VRRLYLFVVLWGAYIVTRSLSHYDVCLFLPAVAQLAVLTSQCSWKQWWIVSVLIICVGFIFTMGETKVKKNVKLTKKRQRLIQNEKKLIFVHNMVVNQNA